MPTFAPRKRQCEVYRILFAFGDARDDKGAVEIVENQWLAVFPRRLTRSVTPTSCIHSIDNAGC